MLTDENPEIYLKRRRLALDYFRHIPEKKVGLDLFVSGEWQDEKQHLQSYGLDALRCQTIACLAGWLWTCPEYRDWHKQQAGSCRDQYSHTSVGGLQRWLGIKWTHNQHSFMARGSGETGSDKAVALARLEGLIKEAEEACRV